MDRDDEWREAATSGGKRRRVEKRRDGWRETTSGEKWRWADSDDEWREVATRGNVRNDIMGRMSVDTRV